MKPTKIIQTIKKYKRFLISTHVNPDPDALCSELALAEYLRNLGKRVSIVNEKEVSRRFGFIQGTRSIKAYHPKMHLDFDVVLIVDCGELERIGEVKRLIKSQHITVNIDHHVTNDRFGKINWVETDASSTAEVLYKLFKKAGNCRLTKNMAVNLYMGIMTDTGSFRYENTSAMTHQIAGELMAFPFSPTALYRKLYETIPLNDLREFTKVVSHFHSLGGGKVLCVELSKSVLAKFSEEFDLRDAIFTSLRAIKGVEVISIFTYVNPYTTRVNLRSMKKVDVAKLAHQFGGGGHKRASGYTVSVDIKQARQMFLQKLKGIL